MKEKRKTRFSWSMARGDTGVRGLDKQRSTEGYYRQTGGEIEEDRRNSTVEC